jgi:MFS family permease
MREKIKHYTSTTFSSLSIRNYKLYFVGQGISMCGTWIQTIAQTWLIFKLTGSGTYIGLLTAVQFTPILLLGPFGGLLTDRFPKRRILYVTQTVAMTLSLLLAILVLTNTVQVWMVFVLAVCLGLVQVVDNPTRQTFILEMVGRDQLTNAVTLNSIQVNMARIVGPAIAGGLIAGIGIGYCFLVNAVSYVAVLACLVLMRAAELQAAPAIKRAKGQLREGFRYVRRTPGVRTILIMMAVIGTLTYEFPVVLPILASKSFHADAGGYSFLMAAMGIGAVVGGIITANRKNATPRAIALAAFGFGVAMLLTAASPHLLIAGLCMVLVGIGSISFSSVANSTLQLQTAPEMRGRVMSLWTMAFLGSTPIGGPLIGYISEHSSPRVGLVVGGSAAIAAGIYALLLIKRAGSSTAEVPISVELEKPAA